MLTPVPLLFTENMLTPMRSLFHRRNALGAGIVVDSANDLARGNIQSSPTPRVLRGDLPGPLKSFARTTPLQKALADSGAAGSITIPTPKSMDFPGDRVAANASRPGIPART